MEVVHYTDGTRSEQTAKTIALLKRRPGGVVVISDRLLDHYISMGIQPSQIILFSEWQRMEYLGSY